MNKNITNLQRKNNIVKNLNFLLAEYGETKTSFSQKTGLTRATIYKILEGKVSNAQQSTISRISDFFGVSCETIENTDLSKVKELEEKLSFDGNRNPIALPLIPASHIRNTFSKPIGQLVQIFDSVHYFGVGSNYIALHIDIPMGEAFEIGAILIINRSPFNNNSNTSLFLDSNNFLSISSKSTGVNINCKNEEYVGTLIEER